MSDPENTKIDILRKQAIERLVRAKKMDTSQANISAYLRDAMPFGTIEKGNQQTISDEVGAMLNERAKAVGAMGYQNPSGAFGTWTAEAKTAEFNAVAGRIEAKGANPLDPTQQEIAEQLKMQTRLMQELVNQGKPGIPPRQVVAKPAGW